MISRVVSLIAIGSCVLVAASFVLFAHDQLSGASKHQQNEIAATANPTAAPTAPAKEPQVRRYIDSAATTLTAPFTSIISSHNPWARRGVPTLLALFAYGLGLSFVARSLRVPV